MLSNPAIEKGFTRNGLFSGRPKGFMICDSYNNGAYKFEQTLLDTNQSDWPRVWDEYLKKYSLIDRPLFFPTHYIIDTVQNIPQIISTRPISYKSLMPGYENWITLMIIGDSTRDVYTPSIYKLIADMLINPIFEGIQSWRETPKLDDNVKIVNMGDSFVPQLLSRYLK